MLYMEKRMFNPQKYYFMTTKKPSSRWSVIWKTLVAVLMLLIILLGSIRLYNCISSWYYRLTREYPQSLSNELNVEVRYRYYYCDCRVYDVETGEALTPRLNYLYTGIVHDTLTVFADKENKRGFLNTKTGKIALPAQWDHAWVFSEGVGAVVKNNRLGFIDHAGNWVIQPQFSYALEGFEPVFKQGICTIIDTSGLFGIIDKQGQWVLAPEYTSIERVDCGYRILRKDYTIYGLADSTGRIVLPCEYSNIVVSENGIILAKEGRKWMVSTDLKEVIHPYMIDDQFSFSVPSGVYTNDGEAYKEYEAIGYYRIDCNYGLLNRQTGKAITPAIYYGVEYVSPNLFCCYLSNGSAVFFNVRGEEVKSPL